MGIMAISTDFEQVRQVKLRPFQENLNYIVHKFSSINLSTNHTFNALIYVVTVQQDLNLISTGV